MIAFATLVLALNDKNKK
ncbi:hypothetical protein NF340_04085 [Lactococcus formosensis]|nr:MULTISPECIES: hypothetical protein [Lactococcus]MCH1723497.1 hypothetical protein [Lactococcus formosensis]MCO7180968.1 hypothetical protein [Lactococcus formosensis]MDG6112001.1 hypothetical protein [Lactococcus formosensis]MDG6113384.1 hypothetical protein [Lactococcus formosensis]MDG6116503.1 hypothetical protein [Lactococcus formosensis]